MNQNKIQELFVYRDGNLYWKLQPARGSVDLNKPAGYVNTLGYRNIMIDKKAYGAHRLIFLMHYGWLPRIVDHEDQNPSNNELCNLRPATDNQNKYNVRKTKSNTSGYRGVSLQKNGGWRATIRTMSKRMHLGIYGTAEEAAHAYDRAAREHHGKFACLNFPGEA